MPVPGSTVSSFNRNKTCPSPSFDARHLKNAKWSSTEEIAHKEPGSFKDLPQTWVPRNQPSPSPDRRDFKPVNFDSNSLKRSKRSISTEGTVAPPSGPAPVESFAWKDSTLDRELRAIKDKKFSDAPEPRSGRDGANDGLNRSLQNWANTPLPKPEDPDVILLKKARQEKKVKRYLEDNFKNREGLFTPEPDTDDIGALSTKYGLDRRREDQEPGSPPKSPPPFSKAESRFEREQRIRVGSLDSYTPGGTLQRQKSISPPPNQSSAQQKYDKERFRVEPGRIENYTIGKGNLAQQESYKAGLTKSTGGGIEGCGITKYSGSHSFNPLLVSKSSSNLSIRKANHSEGNNLQRTLKDGYESDSTLSYRRHQFIPQQSQNKSLYTQVQKGGEVPHQGLRMQAPDKRDFSRPSSAGGWRQQNSGDQESEEQIRRRQKQQLDSFYKSIDQQKETQLRVDLESRKHHDTLLPSQKSPVPLNRYEQEDTNGNQALFLNAGKKPSDCKMVAKASFSFTAQNNRELSFRKGDIIYIKKQVDSNWYEGERNGSVGIFPVTYVEILPSNTDVNSTISRKEKSNEGQAKAKFNFTAQSPMELSLIKGEHVTLTRRIDKNWYEGRIGSRKGILPVSYVEVLTDLGDSGTNSGLSTLLPKPAAAPAAHSILKNGTLASSSYVPVYEKQKPMVIGGSASPYSTLSRPDSSLSNGKPEPTPFRALYNYKPQNEDEVELCEGDIVYVMEKCDDGWFVGTSQRTGIFGTFPGNYVTHV